ncbi:MAG: FKBP-type peptidyl-prolyl cis-trans isomerase [Verrucomicrobiota bacterium]|nr:FKBP-type peptidyl-prolyl cis-trans isomerase [Verrucomicrobiota bacterium]
MLKLQVVVLLIFLVTSLSAWGVPKKKTPQKSEKSQKTESVVIKPVLPQPPLEVILPDGVKYKNVTEGIGQPIVVGQKAQVSFVISSLEGKKILNTTEFGRGLNVQVGDNRFIPGFHSVLRGMKPGSKRTAFLPADSSFGEAGVPPLIPAGVPLTLQIELISVQ